MQRNTSVRDDTHAASFVKVGAKSKGYLTTRPTAVARAHRRNHRIDGRYATREALKEKDRSLASSKIRRCVFFVADPGARSKTRVDIESRYRDRSYRDLKVGKCFLTGISMN